MRAGLRWCTSARGLAVLFVAGFLVRLAVSFNTGHVGDLEAMRRWSMRLASDGPGDFFAPNFLDRPLQLYFYFGYSPFLWLIGEFSAHVLHRPPPDALLKLPAILADLGLAAVAMTAAARLSPHRSSQVRAAAAAAVLLNPAFIYLSAVWGQVDSVAALMVVGALTLLGTGSRRLRAEILAAALLGVALCTKPQTMLIMPVVALALLVRQLRERPPAAAIARTLGLALVVFVAFVVPGLPYGLGPAEMIEYHVRSLTEVVHVLSISAFNLWAVVGFYDGDTGGRGDPTVLGLAPHDVGIALFAAGAVMVLVWMTQRLRAGDVDGRVLFAGAAAMNALGFAVLTRIHERYLFLGLALLVPLVAHRAFRRLLAALSVLFLLNLYLSYTLTVFDRAPHGYRIEPLYDWVYGTHLDTFQQKVLSAVTGVVCLSIVVLGGRWLRAWRVGERAPASARR